MNRLKIFIPVLVLFLFLSACKTDNPTEAKETVKPNLAKAPFFNEDSAYIFIEKQVAFGPRVPNSAEHKATANWLVEKMKNYADTVYVQEAKLKAFTGELLESYNIIGAFNPKAKTRILLAAHWDTRPFADQDTKDIKEPIAGANDGGSGVGVLLEIARVINENPMEIGIDIILFDSEDYGQPSFSKEPYMPDSYCLGSQYWAANPHVENYTARFGILLDMVGAQHAVFTHEGTSVYYAKNYTDKIWQIAHAIGNGSYFSFQQTPPITDDHLYINKIANIPTVDIIQYDVTTRSGFGEYWHTHNDDMDVIDKNTLKSVGQTVVQVIYQYDSGVF